ncbi:hypothetical protein L596_003712 [Steinernema carpocapsae]|uniref:Uncharacterized protein n=1 Tax=Steinernema carpocapsae TaxID=34508 RepID=A0A4U8UV36_STECR|nr:hypothetical protein L596_003712 [Steinernema carpocapsae]
MKCCDEIVGSDVNPLSLTSLIRKPNKVQLSASPLGLIVATCSKQIKKTDDRIRRKNERRARYGQHQGVKNRVWADDVSDKRHKDHVPRYVVISERLSSVLRLLRAEQVTSRKSARCSCGSVSQDAQANKRAFVVF